MENLANFFFNHDFQFCPGTNWPCWFLIIELKEAGIGVWYGVSKEAEDGQRLPALQATPEPAVRLFQGWPTGHKRVGYGKESERFTLKSNRII
jgi:hypothetical protein